ncbi:hypothetical protein [Peribacillus asahii]|uniref:hypothetical protein n=1 Tax=Peribacillus asahii TaxID=228899 RepID=UPI000FD9EB62|nr:hypothetical protein [Peribacillus asahii]USK86256.1 hypothetical protein LIT35_06340 [Peribacillus asahii]
MGATTTFGSLYRSDTVRTFVQGVPIEFDFPRPISNTNLNSGTNRIMILVNGVHEITATLTFLNTGSATR